MDRLDRFLADSRLLEIHSPEIETVLERLGTRVLEPMLATRLTFEWVRDQIAHSMDAGRAELTCSARQVLSHGHGLCFAKSHLLVALLRAQGIAAGFGYQLLRTDGTRSGFGLHGFVQVYDEERHAFYGLDPRGNNGRVCTAFDPATPSLAFVPDADAGERTYPEAWSEPLESVTRFLESGMKLPLALAELPERVDNDST